MDWISSFLVLVLGLLGYIAYKKTTSSPSDLIEKNNEQLREREETNRQLQQELTAMKERLKNIRETNKPLTPEEIEKFWNGDKKGTDD